MRSPFYFLLLTFVLTGWADRLFAGDYTDRKYHFKISVPDSWKSDIRYDGSDKVYDFLSPDENVFIQVRAFPATKGLTIDLLTRVYEKEYLPTGSHRNTLETKTMPNGSAKSIGTYTGRINNREVIMGVYYILHRGTGYVLTTVIPAVLFSQKQNETRKILHSFVVEGLSPSVGSNKKAARQTENHHTVSRAIPPFQAVKITQAVLGDKLVNHTLLHPASRFQAETGKIFLQYRWQGEGAVGHTLKITWIYQQNYRKIKQESLPFPAGRSKGGQTLFVARPSGGWPPGNYLVTFEIAGQTVKEIPFTITGSRGQNTTDRLNAGKSQTHAPVPVNTLFAGAKTGAKVQNTTRQAEPIKKAMPQAAPHPFDISEQVKFWAAVPLSHGTWEKIPLKSTLRITRLHSNRMSFRVYASGYRTSSSFTPHIIHFNGESRSNERERFNYTTGNQNYAVDHANDVFSLSSRHFWICGPKGMIMFSGHSGYQWKKQETPVNRELYSISFANQNNGCATGNNGTILVTRNGGKTWQKKASPVSGEQLIKVVMVDARTGYILVKRTTPGRGIVIKTTDGGQSWQTVYYNTGFQTPLQMADMSFVDAKNGWICGKFGLVFRTSDGGQTWGKQPSARKAAQNKNLRAIFMVNRREGWAAGDNGTLIYTKNGGKTWERKNLNTTAHLVALEFNGPYLGWVASGQTVFQYYDKRFDTYTGAFVKKFPPR